MRFVVIGGGPGGNTAATYAARLGAEVTLIERDVIGGAAHLWDCIPSKTMIATGGAMSFARRIEGMGLSHQDATPGCRRPARGGSRRSRLTSTIRSPGLLESQGVRLIRGPAGSRAPTRWWPTPTTASRRSTPTPSWSPPEAGPRIPDWADPDGERVLTTRQAYPPPTMPEHLVVIGSGVTGVEFVHMFSSFGAKVTLIVSRQQVLPSKDPEVAAALEDELLRRGVRLFKGARADGIERTEGEVAVHCDDGRVAQGSHALLAIGSMPNSDGLGLKAAGVEIDRGGYITDQSPLPVERRATSTRQGTCRASCRCRRWRRCRAARSPST